MGSTDGLMPAYVRILVSILHVELFHLEPRLVFAVISTMSSMQAGLQGLLNVTADSLAEYCGLTGDQQENSVFLERQVCILLAIPSSSPFSHLCISLACSKGIHPQAQSTRVFSSQGPGLPPF